MPEQKIEKRRWAHYSNICKSCHGHGRLLNTSELILEQCPHCNGTGYGDQEPPDDGAPGSSNAA